MCQEVGHTFGLDHQDEDFFNPNIGTCMDYTTDPDGTILGQLSNEHPNQHDYDMLKSIYAHLNRTVKIRGNDRPITRKDELPANARIAHNTTSEWGQEISRDAKGHGLLGRSAARWNFILPSFPACPTVACGEPVPARTRVR